VVEAVAIAVVEADAVEADAVEVEADAGDKRKEL
jgi:hypothetical protein